MNEPKDVVEHPDREPSSSDGHPRRLSRLAVVIVAAAMVLVVGTGVLLARAYDAAPEVIAAVASERRAEIEQRFRDRVAEASDLVGDGFAFLRLVWDRNDALAAVRVSLDNARLQADRLRAEVVAAAREPRDELGTLYKNGPPRAKAILAHLVTAAELLADFLPAVVAGLGAAVEAVDDVPDGELVTATLEAFEAATAPLVADSSELGAARDDLMQKAEAWRQHVGADIAFADERLSGDSLQTEFQRRLVEHVF